MDRTQILTVKLRKEKSFNRRLRRLTQISIRVLNNSGSLSQSKINSLNRITRIDTDSDTDSEKIICVIREIRSF
jgi:hypothetical protein